MEHENFGKCLDAKFDVRVITPNDGFHYFFGYYDLNAYHENGKYHLAHRVKFMDRLPEKDDVCELGYIDLETKEFTKFAETTAWNFQQGALMTYNKSNYDEVFYNVRMGENDYSTCTHNLKTGEKKYTDRACGCISPDGKWGLAVNFNRIYDFRPGYGYAGVKDRWFDIPQPEDDGVFLVDMKTGKSKLIISVARILKEFPNAEYPDAKFVVNHITFNPTSDRFLFLFRNFQTETNPGWLTSLITSDLEGNMFERLHNTMVSHYHWKNSNQIMFFGEIDSVLAVHLVDDLSDKYITYDTPYITVDKRKDEIRHTDIHCIYSPNQKYFIGDSYPKEDHCRHIYLYNLETRECEPILKDYSVRPSVVDIRCDLHDRWNVKGDRISFDSTRNGRREICEIDVSELEWQ